MLTTPQIILNLIVVAALALTLTNRLRSDLVALLVLLTLTFTGLVSPEQALSGLSNPAVLTLVGLFLISHGLEETGIAGRVAAFIRRAAGTSETKLVALFMGAGALLSLAMNNVAAGAVLLPVAVQVSQESGVPASKLLLPLSFGTLVGGMATYFTTANIVISGLLVETGLPGLTMGDFLPVGGLIVLAGILVMTFIGRRLLPNRPSVGTLGASALSRALAETYGLHERLWELKVRSGSPLVDVTLADSSIGEVLGLSVLSIWRNGIRIPNPAPSEVLRPGDHVLIVGREDRVVQLFDWGMELTPTDMSHFRGETTPDLTEVIIPPRSTKLGKTLAQLGFREKTGLSVIAIWREGRSYRTDVNIFPLNVGDALLVAGPPTSINRLARDPNYLVTRSAQLARPQAPEKAPIALIIMALALVAAIVNIVPISLAMLAGGVAMVLTGCFDMDEAYRAIEWRVIFLIAGFLPLSIALQSTGMADIIGGAVVSTFGGLGAVGFVSGAFLVTMLVTQIVGGQVAALLMGPIVLAGALQLGADPQTVGLAAAVACSAAFLTPMSHPVNVLMMGPGGYRPGDFARVGLLMTIVTFVMLIVGVMLFRGLG